MDSTIPDEVGAIFQDFIESFAPLLGDTLQAVYVAGSAVHGAYLPGRSDVDGFVILTEDWRERGDQDVLNQEWDRLQARYPQTTLQIQFASMQYMLQHMPFVDVVDWQTTGILIHGTEVRNDLQPISLEMLRLDMLLCFLGRYAGPVGHTLPYRWDVEADAGSCCRHPSMIVLWMTQPARMLYTWETGAIVSKAESVDWFAQRHPGPSSDRMCEGIAWREAGFPDAEQVVMRWGPEIPALTARFAAFLLDKLSGGNACFESPLPDRPLAEIMADLYHVGSAWLDSVPALSGRYHPMAL